MKWCWEFNAHPEITAYELSNCLAICIQMQRGDDRDYEKSIRECRVGKYFTRIGKVEDNIDECNIVYGVQAQKLRSV